MTAPRSLAEARTVVDPALRAAIETIPDERMRLISAYQMGWCDADGTPVSAGGGKALRPTLAVLSAQVVGGTAADGVPAAVAVELVHNFSLLHDDVMDRDVERRHRPTGWVAFGEGQAILAGNAMLTVAIEALVGDGAAGQRALPCLLTAIQQLISGQSEDLALEQRPDVELADVLRMESGKTAALMACSASIGALAAGAPPELVERLAGYGHDLGMSFQLIDDILGVTGDPAVTGKSSSSDLRAGKRSAPIVAALRAGNDASRRLTELLAGGPPTDEQGVTLAAKLVEESGGLEWAVQEAEARLTSALQRLDTPELHEPALTDLVELGRFVVERDR